MKIEFAEVYGEGLLGTFGVTDMLHLRIAPETTELVILPAANGGQYLGVIGRDGSALIFRHCEDDCATGK